VLCTFVGFSVAEPQGHVSEQYVVAGDNITINCSVDYHGPENPYIEWTDVNDEVVPEATEWIGTDNETNPDAVISTRVSEINVYVPDDAEYLPTYTCTVRFYSYDQRPEPQPAIYHRHWHYYVRYSRYDNVYTPYNWTSPEIKVSCK